MHLKEVKTDTISAPYLECLMKIPNYENPSIPTVDWGIFLILFRGLLEKRLPFGASKALDGKEMKWVYYR